MDSFVNLDILINCKETSIMSYMKNISHELIYLMSFYYVHIYSMYKATWSFFYLPQFEEMNTKRLIENQMV